LVAATFSRRTIVCGTQVVGPQQAAVAGMAETGSTEDGTARAAIGDILGALQAHGLIAE
jgi:hypothetical protein